jgi:DNA-binding LacI/PurR family transcriptional regulator
MSEPMMDLSFKILRSSRKTLVEQVVDGLRGCIVSGEYAPGDILPTTRDLAVALGVSRIVTRTAVRILAEEGLVNPKPGVGSVVLGRGARRWNGRVLLVSPSDGRTYYVNVFTAVLRERLVKAGWMFAQATVPLAGSDVSELELSLCTSVDLAIVMFANSEAQKVLARAGVPFVVLCDADEPLPRGCNKAVRFSRSFEAGEVAAACRRAGIGSVLEVGCENKSDLDAALAREGIGSGSLVLKPSSGAVFPEAVARIALEEFDARLTESRSWLPDLLYFSDDYTCIGALAALQARGVRIPEDVRVLTWSNAGNTPVFIRPLARVEMDPVAHAAQFASAVLSYLKNGEFQDLALVPTYIPGATFLKEERNDDE